MKKSIVLGLLAFAGVALAGIAVTPLRAAVRLWLEALETVPQSSPPPLPQLQLTEGGSLP